MFVTDKPIITGEDDLLGRSDFATQLAEAIASFSMTDNFAIGLYGPWGSGKTSVLNMALEHLKDQSTKGTTHITIVEFNPWNFTSCNQLLNQFFKSMSAGLKIVDMNQKKENVGIALEKYASALEYSEYIPVVGKYLKILPTLAKGIGQKVKNNASAKLGDIAYQREAVEKALKEYQSKIVVVIDDIDRLPNEQIRLVFQLVSAVADFPNVIYLLSFDKRIVARALENIQGCNGEEYLEKIIQVPFELPEVAQEKVTSLLTNKLVELFKDCVDDTFDKQHWQKVYQACIIPFVASIRDIKRYMNVLQFKFAPLKGEVNCIDLAGITALQLFATPVFEWIRENKSILTGGLNPYEGVVISEQKEEKERWLNIFSDVYSKSPTTMIEAVCSLFPRFAHRVQFSHENLTEQELRNQQRIAHSERFSNYFSLSTEKITISRAMLNWSFFSASQSELLKFLMSIDKDNLTRDYLEELQSGINRIPAERIALFISILFSILGNMPNSDSFFLSTAEYCRATVWKLLLRIDDNNEKEILLCDLVIHASLNSLIGFSVLLNRMELAQGRLAANGQQRETTAISAKSLDKIEQYFLSRLEQLVLETPLLDWNEFLMPAYLWRCFSLEHYNEYMKDQLMHQVNILKYVSCVARRWTGSDGSGWSFRIDEDFTDLLTTNMAIEAIHDAIENKLLFTLPEASQKKITSFMLFMESDHANDMYSISELDAAEQLAKWKDKEIHS